MSSQLVSDSQYLSRFKRRSQLIVSRWGRERGGPSYSTKHQIKVHARCTSSTFATLCLEQLQFTSSYTKHILAEAIFNCVNENT
mmetsp:Transcript_11319/g.14702  ORF Transcript_11319/g.14702 Transcript_11319/m.14702 type:complete len:84 (+) Transcript_11319:1419-1670(+)